MYSAKERTEVERKRRGGSLVMKGQVEKIQKISTAYWLNLVHLPLEHHTTATLLPLCSNQSDYMILHENLNFCCTIFHFMEKVITFYINSGFLLSELRHQIWTYFVFFSRIFLIITLCLVKNGTNVWRKGTILFKISF